MADFILFISIVSLIALGYYAMCRLDNFIAAGRSVPQQTEYKDKDVLLYKGPYEIYSLLDKSKISYDIVDYPSLPDWTRYRIVFGLSESDLDNLLLCSGAKHADFSVKTVARCNDQVYRDIFMREDIDAVVFDMQQAKAILNEWKVIH
jgi:hypothetical protein